MSNQHNSKLPTWVLSPSEETRARHNLKLFTYDKCHDLVEAMAQCAKKNGIKVFPRCNAQRDAMKDCVLFYQQDSNYLDEQRRLIISEKINKLYESLQKDKKQID